MIKSKIIFLLFIISTINSVANNYVITGKIIDTENKLIEIGNVILLNPKDSSIIKGELFMSGQFRISSISDDELLLKITSVGYQDNFQLVKRTNTDTLVDIGTITLKINNNLKQVEVISKLPLFERDGEKVKVNVENSVLSSAGTVLDVLKKSPTVMIDNSDNVSIFGKGNAVIYIDGQQIASNDILKTISSTEIKEIEIIANPFIYGFVKIISIMGK